MTDYVRKQGSPSGAQIIKKEALTSTLGAQTTTQSRKYRLRWWTLGVISLGLLAIMMDEMILNVALPTLQRELGASASGLQWMVNSYLLAFGALLLMMGGLSDRFGRARMLQIGLIVFGLSSVAAAFAGSAMQLIGARALMGAGAAMIMPATLAIIVDVFDAEERARAIAIWAALAGIGLALGPLLGGLLLSYFWWGSVFLVNVPIVGVALVAGWYLVPESRDPEAKPLDILGTLLSASAISALVYVIIAGPDAGWTSPLIWVPAAVGLFLGIGFVIHEMRTQYPLLDFAFFRQRRFSTGAVAISLMFLNTTGMLFGMPQYLQFVQGYSPLEAGIRLLPVAAGMMIGAMGSEPLVRRFGTTKVVAGGLLLLAATLSSVLLWELNTAYWVIGITVAVVGFGAGAVMAPATEAIMGAVPRGKVAVGSAVNDVTRTVSAALGVAVIGSTMYSLYSSRVADALVGLPAEAATAAKDSLGAALQIAASLPGEAGAALSAAARQAFTDGFGVAMLVGAVSSLVGAVLVAKFMPARQEPLPEIRSEQGESTKT